MSSAERSPSTRVLRVASRVREEARNILMTPADVAGGRRAGAVAVNALADIYGHMELVPGFHFLTRYPVVSYIHDVTPHLSRGIRPEPEDVRALHEAGFGAIVSLCAELPDGNAPAIAAAGLGDGEIEHHHHGMVDMAVPSLALTVAAIETLRDLEARKVRAYVACHASRLRAGVVVGCFREAVQGWSPEDAVAEARNFGNFIPMQLAHIERFGRLLTERFDALESGRGDPHPELGAFPIKRPGSVRATSAELAATFRSTHGGGVREAVA